MAVTFVQVKVTNPAKPKRGKKHEFLVDSGAFYTVMPTGDLEALGIKPSRQESFLLANGEIITKPVGNAFFEFQGKIGAAPVVFGEKEVYLLGATTLEALALILDPINRQLKPAPLVMMGYPRGLREF